MYQLCDRRWEVSALTPIKLREIIALPSEGVDRITLD